MKQNYKTSGAGVVQVFELTMDNSEDQDELNRRLRKPGEPAPSESTKPGEAASSAPAPAQDESASDPS